MEFVELASLIKDRRSIRRWQDKKIPEELLLQAVELATWAPNGGNQQNWYFYVIINPATINAIADVVQASTDEMVTWPEAKDFGDIVAKWQSMVAFFRSAPAAIAVTTSRYQSIADKILAARENNDPRASEIRQWRSTADSRVQSAASAIAYLLLIFHQMGLGSVWMTGPIQAKGEIEKLLRVPPEMDLIAFLPVGYPAESPTPKERRPVKEVTNVIR